MNPSFPAKLILFGEYAIVLGAEALAIPLTQFAGQLVLPPNANDTDKESNKRLLAFYDHLMQSGVARELNMARFRVEAEQGLYFRSTIPVGYGLGSSGALCAALYSRYKHKDVDKPLALLKKEFASMESYFHGQSSGIDPLVIYLRHNLLLSSDHIQKVALDWQKIKTGLTIFLIDTHTVANTGTLVEEFLHDVESDAYSKRIAQEYLPLTRKVIDSFMAHDESFYPLVERLSAFQLEYFRKMIPDNYMELWRHGLLNRKFALKLCGSGGGGYVLGFSKEPPEDVALLFDRTFQEEVTFIQTDDQMHSVF